MTKLAYVINVIITRRFHSREFHEGLRVDRGTGFQMMYTTQVCNVSGKELCKKGEDHIISEQ